MIPRRKFIKRGAIIAPFIFLPNLIRAQPYLLNPALLGANQPAASGGGATYLIKQDFEGTGYDNSETWTEFLGTPNEDYTGTVLDGAQSLLCTANQGTRSPVFAGLDEIWFYCMIRFSVLKDSDILKFYDAGQANQVQHVALNADGTITVSDGAFHSATTVTAFSANTTYHLWVRVKKGTGANGEGEVWVSTTTTRGTGNNHASHATGNQTWQPVQVELLQEAGTASNFIFDKVRVDDVVIGDAPS